MTAHFQTLMKYDAEIAEAWVMTEQEIHSLPCRIEYTGKANVDKFFNAERIKDGEATFRGRKLSSQKIRVPKGYTGRVNHQNFTVMNVWCHDQVDETADAFKNAIDFLKVASVLE